MPTRMLREGILDSEKVERLSFHGEVFYRRLMSVVDDFGLYDARPTILRTRLFPLRVDRVSEKDILGWLDECINAGLVALYEVSGHKYLQFLNLGEPRAVKSKFPKPPDLNTPVNTCAQVNTDASKRIQTRASVPPCSLRPVPTHTPTGDGVSVRFNEFFREYPKKKDRHEAEKAFEEIGPDDGLFRLILAAVRERAKADDWKAEQGRYVPRAADWLRDRRWEEVKVPNGVAAYVPSRAVTEKHLRDGKPLTEAMKREYPDLAEKRA